MPGFALSNLWRRLNRDGAGPSASASNGSAARFPWKLDELGPIVEDKSLAVARNVEVGGADVTTAVCANLLLRGGSIHEAVVFDSVHLQDGQIDILHCLEGTEIAQGNAEIGETKVWNSVEEFLAYAMKMAKAGKTM